MRKTVWVLLLVLAIPFSGFGQNDLASWQNLERLKPGNTIRVLKADSTDVTGKFLRSSADAIYLEMAGKESAIERIGIDRIDVRKPYKRVLHALLGAGIGVGAGIIGFAAARSEDSFYGVALPLFPVFVGAGTVAGALIPGYSTIYRAQP